MKKIGIFHTIPTKAELQKNYLFFDELQTSLAFLETTFDVFKQQESQKDRYIDSIIEHLNELAERGVIVLKEDIEKRILPIIGSFDSSRLEREVVKKASDTGEEAIFSYFKKLIEIRKIYALEVRGTVTFEDHLAKNINASCLTALIWSIDQRTKKLSEAQKNDLNEINALTHKNQILNTSMLFNKVVVGAEVYSRVASGLLNTYFNDNSYFPIVNKYGQSLHKLDLELKEEKQGVINLIINRFPIPDQGVEWEKIIEFKNDKKAMYKLYSLRLWIEELSTKSHDLSVVKDKLEQLLFEYEESLKLFKIKYVRTGLEAVIVPLAEAAENIARFKFSDAVKALFSMSQKNIQMFEEERKLQGREVAYISEIDQKLLK